MALAYTINQATLESTLPPQYYNDARVLAANVAETVTVPTWAQVVILSPNIALGEVWCNWNATAAIPAADVTDGSASFRGTMICKVGGTSLSVISPNAGVLSLTFYK